MTAGRLKALYRDIYRKVRWPKPIPWPGTVTLQWRPTRPRFLGQCYPDFRLIEIAEFLGDPRLRRLLRYVVIHEAAHFVWREHSRAFRSFLVDLGYTDEVVARLESKACPIRFEYCPPRYAW